jgi:creatinine amidohydrolase
MQAEHMTWEEYRDEVGHRIVILPVGSFEQHGPHLPLNVDVVIPMNFATRVAERINGMVLAPITYGYKSHPTSGGGQLFPGTTSLDGVTLIHLVLDILRETYRHGGRRFLIMNGHYENVAFITEAIDLFMRDSPDSKVLLVGWWEQISDELVEEVFAGAGFPGWDTEHAGITETSLMQLFAPELVREDKIIDDQSERKPTYDIYPTPDDIIPNSGVLYKATFASQEKGEKVAKHVTERIIQIVHDELGSS